MVHVGLLGGNCFWIDQTEVPRSDYKTFLAAADTARYVGPGCEADSTHSTTACEQTNANSSAKITLADDHPIVCVDWCDAWAYCEWAGKTLCQGNWTKEADPTVSMFYSACSDGGQNPYPTGKNLDAQACNGAKNPVTGCESGSCTTAAVGTTACRTPEGAFDLAGNVREWTAECSGTSATSECRARGGSMIDVDLTCSSQGTSYRKQIGYPTVGFRCCASAP
jgi:formylglycine-generating enzyme required for sulfatase activity